MAILINLLPEGFQKSFCLGMFDVHDGIEQNESIDLFLLRSIKKAMGKLTDREIDFVLSRCDGETYQSIADRWSISKDRVRQVEHKALNKIRFYSRKFTNWRQDAPSRR